MSQENVEKVRSSLEGWNRGDIDAWLEWVHPEVEWFSEVRRRMTGDEAPVRGKAGMREFWDEWHAIWELVIDITEMRDLGETVLVLARFRTRGQASGVDLEQPIAYVFEFDGGLARRARAYLDPQKALEAVGLGDQGT
jgi:ketosteroid isomerase-like protein